MSNTTPVILLGTDTVDGSISVVGLYENEDKATEAVQSGTLPNAHYSLMIMKMNSHLEPRKLPEEKP